MQLTTTRSQRANPNARNYGLRSRNITVAAKNALKEKFSAKANGFKTVQDNTNRFSQFASFVKSNYGVNDMRNITAQHVQAYGEQLCDRIDSGSLSVKSAHDYLSAVNSVMAQARGDHGVRVTASEAGIPNRTGITVVDKAISEHQHKHVITNVDDRLAAQLEIQRELGLRFEEAAKFDAKSALDEANKTQQVTISDGTKGGRDRCVPITQQSQIDAIKGAADIQQSDRSMIPSNMSYAEYQQQSYRELSQHQNYHSHGERHAFAQHVYQNEWAKQSGVPDIKPPVVAGIDHGCRHHQYLAEKTQMTPNEAKAIDQEVRSIVAEQLGHSRIDITNYYLG
ncbi:integrase domain-containing protein [Photobacterium leiognathi]|uniref:integrase domain-containing protein n=1 Tax=Photobacterium leiognathi TaxID=553611 RepID=UPI002980FDF9|nr:integrase domain-containing protein [Photobacterium leiognathi]